jgi:hypothetical protein
MKGKTKEELESLSNRAYLHLLEKSAALSQIAPLLKESMGIELVLSEEFVRKDKEISEQHKEVLQKLKPQSFSFPIVQSNKKDGGFLSRIFYLKDYAPKPPPTFNEMEEALQGELLKRATARCGELYAERLRERYGVTDDYLAKMIPEDFVPFVISPL